MDQVAGIPQEAIEGVGEVPCYLLHSLPVRLVMDPSDRHAARL